MGYEGMFPKWFRAWGPWWAVFWSFDHTFSLGVHIDPRYRPRAPHAPGEPSSYGPYVDIHLPMLCISFGNNPVYVSPPDARRPYAKGGKVG